MRRVLLRISLAILLPASVVVVVPATGWSAARAGATEASARYIVVLDGASPDPAGVARRHLGTGGRLGYVYRSALRGFSATLSASAVRALRADPHVVAVEPDATAHITAQKVPFGVQRIFADRNPGLKVGDGADERVDADVAILDTGIDLDHPDLNVVARTNCLNSTSCRDGEGDDDNGHGSNVAGIAGALDNGIGVVGVAPGARLWAVKVLDANGSGSLSGITAGIDWVASHAAEIEVANMSLGCTNCSSTAIDTAISNAVGKGVVFTVSAGNNRRDAAGQVPANHPDVITVSALGDYDGKPGGLGNAAWCNSRITNRDDTLADSSNFGATIELAAPGDCIESTYKNGGYSNFSGTSQAAPHVAGAAAWLASGDHKPRSRADVAAIRDTLVAQGNFDWTDDSGDGIKEPLLDVSDTNVFPPRPADPGAPTASFTATCSTANNTCAFDGSASKDPDGTIVRYAWDFGDGTSGTGARVSHTYARSGFLSVTLTVTDNSGKTATTRKLVKVGNLPPSAVIGTHTCSQATCTFDGSGSADPEGAPLTYRWTFGDGTAATGFRITHTYPAETADYTVTLTVTDDRAQTGTATTPVTCRKLFTTALCFSF